MTEGSDFIERIGMNLRVINWLTKNGGDPLREEIITLFLKAINDSRYKDFEALLRAEISKIPL